MKHALVVGGIGMLSNVSLWLADNGYRVSVIARNPIKMAQLIEKASTKKQITPLLVDYKNGFELRDQLKQSIQVNGGIDIVIAWIHSDAEDALEIIGNDVSTSIETWDLYHICGSSSDLEEIKRNDIAPDGCQYHQVQLGFVVEDNHSRWLTNQEISTGVIEAIKKNTYISCVGVVTPWEKRP
ncbi:short-chain dehydrogenase [Salipaludibacillus neizhouensis]|uniref:Short-chain dehydrogenase n=1 Tax=Salipaludibacillus neizhouensis TaxID=885475 RepID=A0A3A9K4Z2_9BACI|nr:short-chain dehydrogenase [Salipaludibacillus neizhouensis]RKL65401.1 short-chain dehydrogenase [Salipaludibacillus neizhouensis]